MARAGGDPKEIVTPDAFSVAPELLGRPLARPWRRAAAMAIDLAAIAILGSAGWFFLGLAIALLLFRAALRPTEGTIRKGSRWAVYGSAGAAVLIVTLAGAWWAYFAGDGVRAGAELAQGVLSSSLGEVGTTVSGVIATQSATTEPELREAAQSLAASLAKQGVEPHEVRETLESLAEERQEPWARDAILAALPGGPAPASLHTDSIAVAYAAAIGAGDSARAGALREPLVEALAGERLASQREQVAELREEVRELEANLERERDRGLISLIFSAADEIGIGFGWAGLYFTFLLTFWRGRTLGKRALGLRVVRLDGKPIGLWAAFNRFGGYAASIFTGLLGFFEMLWDDNRQALHDRIAATVVIRD